jgi:ribosomal protein S18 acetylase RimI-like enzyme
MQDLKDVINKGRKSFKTENGDNDVSIKLLPMSTGIKVAKELIGLIAPAIGSAVDGVRHDDLIHGAPRSFSDLALVLVGQLDKVDVENLIELLLAGMLVNGNEVDLDDHFSANYHELLEIMEFALKENFQTFFIGKGMKARLITAVQTLMAGTYQE